MATKEQYAQAANAVRAGKATEEQKEMNKRAAKEMGPMANDARDAIKNPVKK